MPLNQQDLDRFIRRLDDAGVDVDDLQIGPTFPSTRFPGFPFAINITTRGGEPSVLIPGETHGEARQNAERAIAEIDRALTSFGFDFSQNGFSLMRYSPSRSTNRLEEKGEKPIKFDDRFDRDRRARERARERDQEERRRSQRRRAEFDREMASRSESLQRRTDRLSLRPRPRLGGPSVGDVLESIAINRISVGLPLIPGLSGLFKDDPTPLSFRR